MYTKLISTFLGVGLNFAFVGIASSAEVKLFNGFDDINSLEIDGWYQINKSQPVGTTGWFQGTPAVFGSQSGASDSYVAANFNSTTGSGTISTWLLTPVFTLDNGTRITFYTRAVTDDSPPDRLEIRLSVNGGSVDVGSTETSVGDFNTLLLTINPNLEVGGYLSEYVLYNIMLSSIDTPTPGRLAFRYYVTDGGLLGNNSNYIGIDTLEVTGLDSASGGTAVPFEFSPTIGLIILGAWATLYRWNQRNNKS